MTAYIILCGKPMYCSFSLFCTLMNLAHSFRIHSYLLELLKLASIGFE